MAVPTWQPNKRKRIKAHGYRALKQRKNPKVLKHKISRGRHSIGITVNRK